MILHILPLQISFYKMNMLTILLTFLNCISSIKLLKGVIVRDIWFQFKQRTIVLNTKEIPELNKVPPKTISVIGSTLCLVASLSRCSNKHINKSCASCCYYIKPILFTWYPLNLLFFLMIDLKRSTGEIILLSESLMSPKNSLMQSFNGYPLPLCLILSSL